jgi:uroporphyrinogen III methyltransferase/synthase
LGRVDVVLYDALCNDALLKYAPQAEKICVGKHGHSRIWTQDEISAELVRRALLGQCVARLKGGDPAIFARSAEEITACRAAGIDFEVVPGVTAALAAGSYAGIPITHRGIASAVAFVTGHEEPNKSESALDWSALARFPGTLVVYMGVTTAPLWTRALIEAGKSPDTPTAIIRRCTLHDQQTIHCLLKQVSDHLTPATRMRPPVIVIIGLVTELAQTMSWFDRKPLFGQSILVTRPVDQAEDLAEPLRRYGANVLYQPVIRIAPPSDWTEVDHTIDQLASFDGVLFGSVNGVRYYLQRLFDRGLDTRVFARCRLGTVGSKTRAAIEKYHLRCDWTPSSFSAEALATMISSEAKGKRFLVVRASRSASVLASELCRAGAEVTEIVAYEHADTPEADPEILQQLESGQIDWVTLTSSESARSAVRLFGEELRRTKLATISPITSQTLRELGYEISVEANPHTIESLASQIAAYTE